MQREASDYTDGSRTSQALRLRSPDSLATSGLSSELGLRLTASDSPDRSRGGAHPGPDRVDLKDPATQNRVGHVTGNAQRFYPTNDDVFTRSGLPESDYPVSEYMVGPLPASRYPASLFPGSEFPSFGFPETNYPTSQLPDFAFPANGYPEKSGQYPQNDFPYPIDKK